MQAQKEGQENNGAAQKEHDLLSEDMMPLKQRNAFIHHGYRLPDLSPAQCLVSVFKKNNETSNFWTHFLPCILLAQAYWRFFSEHSIFDPLMWPLASFASVACLHMLISSLAHTFCVLSPRVVGFQECCESNSEMSSKMHDLLFLLDYAGISMYSVGVGQAFFFYLGAPEPKFALYASPTIFNVVALIISIFSTYLTGIAKIRTIKHRALIGVVAYAIPYALSASPFLYKLSVQTKLESQDDYEMRLMCFRQFLIYVSGALLYGFKIPERLAPGLFDYFGNSHNLMHVCTALGAVQIHYLLLKALSTRKELPIHKITIWNTLSVIGICVVINFCVAVFLFQQRNEKQHKKRT